MKDWDLRAALFYLLGVRCESIIFNSIWVIFITKL